MLRCRHAGKRSKKPKSKFDKEPVLYLQITTKCQMSCAHCCFGCRPGVGQDMSKETFKAACAVARDTGSHICLGGGEPTLHPEFWEFLGLAMKYDAQGDSELRILVITNGASTEDALALAGMARKGLIYADLSQDQWHDPIDPGVVSTFERLRKQGGNGGIRTVTTLTNHGSAKANNLDTDHTRCCCEDWLVMPNGKLYGCGCRRYSFGTVHDYEIPEDFQVGEDCAVKWKKGQGLLQS